MAARDAASTGVPPVRSTEGRLPPAPTRKPGEDSVLRDELPYGSGSIGLPGRMCGRSQGEGAGVPAGAGEEATTVPADGTAAG